MPEAVETLHCPTCLCRLVDGGETRCPACRAPISKSARPLPLLEQELQARIAAKTAAHFRERRRAAKTAKRIASLPPTLFETDLEPQPLRTDTSAPEPPRGKPLVVDIPASSVHAVRSTNEVPVVTTRPDAVSPDVEAAVPPVVGEVPNPSAVVEEVADPAPLFEQVSESVRVDADVADPMRFIEDALDPVPSVSEPVSEPVDPVRYVYEAVAPMVFIEEALDPMRFIEAALDPIPTGVSESDGERRGDAGSQKEAVPVPAPAKPKARKRIRVVERLAERVAEKVVERVTERVAEHAAARVAEPAAEVPIAVPAVVPVEVLVERPPPRLVERPAPRFQYIGPRTAARPAAPAEERAPEPITRIGTPPSVNSVWRDRVFNAANRPAERAAWPRAQASAPVAPVIDLPAEPVIDQIGKAAG